MPSQVVLIRCEDYDELRVHDAVGRGLSLLGGAGQFAGANENILLKVNLLSGAAPRKAVTTHPSVLKAVAQHFQDTGARVSYGDSPGFGRPANVARRAGLARVAEELGLPIADFTNGETASFPDGHLIKQFTVAKGVLEADGVVSLPKMKTHALTRITGAVKNQFGCIPGLLKGEFHARLSEMDRFARMLVDLTRFVHPRLYIMDGIVAMEGNGPGSGDPRSMNVLLFSTDPIALDATMCRIIALDPMLAPTVEWGEKMGLGTSSDIEVLGDPLEGFRNDSFKVNRAKGSTTGSMNSLLARLLRNLIVPRPAIDAIRCTHCGTCVKVCPANPKAVDFREEGKDAPPTYDYSVCLRCYCCQELCPEDAIAVDTPLLGRIVHR